MSDYEEEEELINYTLLNAKKGKKNQAPRRTNKSTEVEHDAVTIAREALFDCIEYQGKMTKQCSKGSIVLDSPPCWTTISVSKGTHLHTMGFSHRGAITLYPEEAAFLISRNALIVTDENDKVLNFQDFCQLLCDQDTDGWITFERYQVYAYLKRLGYIVQRSKPFELPPTTIEPYESPSISIWKLFFDKLSYWMYRNNDMPLVWNYKYKNYRSIYSTLHIIPSSPWYKPFYKSLCKSFDWDVYKPKPTWKKKDPGVPDFRMVVNNIHDPMPTLHEQNQLFSQLMHTKNSSYQTIRNTALKEDAPTFVMALVGDAEGISFLRMVGDGLVDLSLKDERHA